MVAPGGKEQLAEANKSQHDLPPGAKTVIAPGGKEQLAKANKS
jgi:hypothetical protein